MDLDKYKDEPQLKEFLLNFTKRFNNDEQATKFDGDFCVTKLKANEISIFITPAPEHKPLILCGPCCQKAVLKYDITKLQ